MTPERARLPTFPVTRTELFGAMLPAGSNPRDVGIGRLFECAQEPATQISPTFIHKDANISDFRLAKSVNNDETVLRASCLTILSLAPIVFHGYMSV